MDASLSAALELMWKGMLAIFVVIGIIFICTQLMINVTKNKN